MKLVSSFFKVGILTLLVCALGAGLADAQESAPPPAPSPTQQVAPPAGMQPGVAQQPAPQQGYVQQPYPQQPYPQQAYPQQPYPQQAYPQAYPPPAYGAPPPPPPVATGRARPPRPRRGMMIAGISVLSASYGVALIIGSTLIDTRCCEDVGAMLMIPVAGPFAAAAVAENGKAVLTLLGAVELVGTGLMIGGIARYLRSKRALEAEGYYSFALPHGRTLSLDAHTSPRMVGPSMRLRF